MKRWFDKIYLGLIIFLMIIAIYGAVTRTLSYDKVLLILILCNVSYLKIKGG